MSESKELINPYNFVDAPPAPQRTGFEPSARLDEDTYSGTLVVALTAISPLITLDQQRVRQVEILQRKRDKETGEIEHIPAKINCFDFLRRVDKTPIIQGTTLRGMLRSVFEALTDSCMVIGSMDDLKKCTSKEALCPACALFGAIEGEALTVGSRVSVSDATLDDGSGLESAPSDRGFWVIKPQSSPKPHHWQIYKPHGRQAGRKFYYHHDPDADFCADWDTSFCPAVSELAPAGSVFDFTVTFSGLSANELGVLLLAIRLDEDLGHKVGFAKAAGLGSCQLSISPQSRIAAAGSRYQSFQDNESLPWQERIADTGKLTPLREVLRLDKSHDGLIGYPFKSYYKDNLGIDSLGSFDPPARKRVDDRREVPRVPRQKQGPTPTETIDKPATEQPPMQRDDETAVWLKGISDTHFWFAMPDGSDYLCERKVFQGSTAKLKLGDWCYRKGTFAVHALKKKKRI